MNKYYFTSESVTEGHPDKICDGISDYILDEALRQDKNSKMAVEATIKDELILVYGEAKTRAKLDYEALAKSVLKKIGYEEEYQVIVKVGEQSSEINNAVEQDKIMAGDQGIMFGYACRDTDELMPLPIMLANKLAYQLTKVRKENENTFLKPDGKTQVTVEYIDDKPVRVDTIVIATQHKESVSYNELKEYIIDYVIKPIIPKNLIDNNTKVLINTSGSFIIGGSFGDSGTTGRKIVVDTYGGMGKIGGGCFSSKDPSKVDRSGAYKAREIAKRIVKSSEEYYWCEVQLSYAIGREEPLAIYIKTNKGDLEVPKYLYEECKPRNIIKDLELKNECYEKRAMFGHFRD